uniref:Uncharacterized protein n=1 Tax=Anopheles coluzzii TaxID=1518534 RepID=A0A8W7P047_ANOCL
MKPDFELEAKVAPSTNGNAILKPHIGQWLIQQVKVPPARNRIERFRTVRLERDATPQLHERIVLVGPCQLFRRTLHESRLQQCPLSRLNLHQRQGTFVRFHYPYVGGYKFVQISRSLDEAQR